MHEIEKENRDEEEKLWEFHNNQDEDYIEILKENLELEGKLKDVQSELADLQTLEKTMKEDHLKEQ